MIKTANNQSPHYDAIIIGASIAGCITALELAGKGWRILLVEKRQAPDHYKKICTHIIHPAGVNILARHGLMDQQHLPSLHFTGMEIIYQQQVLNFPFKAHHTAANIERRDLDPALRSAIAGQSRITLLLGRSVSEVLQKNNSATGIRLGHAPNDHTEQIFLAPLIIAADGRDTQTVDAVSGQRMRHENHRVALFSYFEKLDDTSASRVWSVDRGQAYYGYFPNQRHALVSWYISRETYAAIAEKKDAHFDAICDQIRKNGIALGNRLQAVMVAKDTSPSRSKIGLKNMALVGDAKLAADPLTGVGCTWAMQSAVMLANCLGAPPSRKDPEHSDSRLNWRIKRYNLQHALRFRVPSALMTLASDHGKWVFNAPIFRSLSRLTR